DLASRVEIGQVFEDRLIDMHGHGELTGEDAAKGKLYTTERQQQVVNEGLQLHGGYGFMRKYPIARSYLDARSQTIFGGTNEIMREIIGRGLEETYGEGVR